MKRRVYWLALLGMSLLGVCGTHDTHALTQQTGKDHATPLPLPFQLTSDGHACSGYFRVSARRIVWKSSFATCGASGWRSSNDSGTWLFMLTQTPTERKHCSIRVVQMRKTNPNVEMSPWEVTGYASVQQLRLHPERPVLSCSSMQ
jgi:hypothetical protein